MKRKQFIKCLVASIAGLLIAPSLGGQVGVSLNEVGAAVATLTAQKGYSAHDLLATTLKAYGLTPEQIRNRELMFAGTGR